MARKRKGITPLNAGLIGAAIGAAGTASAFVLANKKNRQKIGKTLRSLKSKITVRRGHRHSK